MTGKYKANSIFANDEWNAVYTVQLDELIETGVFNWSNDLLDWKFAAYNDEQYYTLCTYFVERFRYREISIVPAREWFIALKRMLVYELMPKYIPLYEQIENGYSPLGENDYFKHREIESHYPETLLSGNSDYISAGNDEEHERITVHDIGDSMMSYTTKFKSVNKAICDELEVLFISMYTLNVNAL